MRSRTTILLVGQAAQKTGLARVTLAIADHLARDYDFHVLGIDCFDLSGSALTENGWTLHGNPFGYDVFAELRLTELVDQIHPKIVVLYNDLWVIHRYFERLGNASSRILTVGYCPIDGRILCPDFVSSICSLDSLVVFTEFGRNAVMDCASNLHLTKQDPFRSVAVIPHGIDTQVFYRWPTPEVDIPTQRLEARQTLFPRLPDLWDGFWVLNANRNQPRKRLDLTLDGFALFAANKPDSVRLYLHTGLNELGTNILKYAQSLGIAERLIVTKRQDDHPDLETLELNLVYNACDVGVNSATGEGWGLISFEHAATGAPQIVPRHSACAELWDGAAELLNPQGSTFDGLLEGHLISAYDLADALERLYTDRVHYQRVGRAGYERATNKKYGWEQVSHSWRILFEHLMGNATIFPHPPRM